MKYVLIGLVMILYCNKGTSQDIADLNFLLGNWTLSSRYLDSEANWVSDPGGNAIFKKVLEGQGIQEDADFYFQGTLYKTRTLIGVDKGRQTYRFAILDHRYGYLDVHEGSFVDGALEISNMNTGTSFLVDNTEYIYKARYKSNDADSFVMSILVSTDQGKNWNKINETVYSRADE